MKEKYYEQFLDLFFNTNLSMPQILKELGISRNNRYWKYCLSRCRAEFGIDGVERGNRIRMEQWK